MTKWTEEQTQAINETGKNIIVSAGAGSGKTAVLTQRVITKLKKGININELLILTFTNLAAHEMKQRIKNELKKENDKDNLEKVDSSYITTFDSYALALVKKYHYLLNLNKDIKIVDSNIIRIKEIKILDEIFEEEYAKKEENFVKLVDDLCTKNDDNLRNEILSINLKLNLKPDKSLYLDNYINQNYTDEKIKEDIDNYYGIIYEKITLIDKKLDEMSYLDCNEYYEKIKKSLEDIIKCKDYDTIVNKVDVKLPVLPKNSSEELKQIKTYISEKLKEIKELCIYKSKEDIKQTILKTKPYTKALINIIKKLDEKIIEYKNQIGAYEFNDIALFALKIVKENEDIRKEIRNSFKEILIDEYQDTNDLQEQFINLISNNNVYMVGDIKQSIYKFRNANPKLFKDKYDNYKKGLDGIKIDLNKNFRSRQEVLTNINYIFTQIMNDKIGGAQYSKEHMMIFGNELYKQTKSDMNFEILTYEDDKTFTKEEKEIFLIAKDIKEKIDNKYQITDKKTFELRDITYDDFAILLDRTTNFDLFKKIFEYLELPVTLIKDETVTDSTIIILVRNILNLILKEKNFEYDDEYKYLFLSISRSFLKEESDDKIFDDLKDIKSSNLSTEIKNLINFEDKTPLQLLDNIIDTFKFYENFEKVGNIETLMVAIDYLKDLAIFLSDIGYDIYDYIEYLNNLKENDYEIKYKVNTSSSNSIKIMTIHKSKGLEFPVCYYAMLYKKFNISELKERVLYDSKYGIIVPYYDNGLGETIYKSLLKNEYMKEEISEKIRLFYVALTRAKEKMIVICPKFDNKEFISEDKKLKYKSFYDILNSINYSLEKYIINVPQIDVSLDYKLLKLKQVKIDKQNSFSTINLNIKKEKEFSSHFSKETKSLITTKEYENMKEGIRIHKIFEMIDFKNPNYENLRQKDIELIKNFLQLDIMKNIKNSNIYKEYEFEIENDGIVNKGVIDLMIEYDDYVDIIDYKLSNINDEKYLEQLNGYKKIVEDKMNKFVNLYLYSIHQNQVKKI